MELIPDIGHFAAFQQPEKFLDLLLTHVRQLADGPSTTIRSLSRLEVRKRLSSIRESSI
jgi:hypothetical protein